MSYGSGGGRRGGGRGRSGYPYPPYGAGYGPYSPPYAPYSPGYGAYGPAYPPPGAPYGGYAPYPPPPPPEQELEMLRDQAQYLEDTLAEIRKRIEELEAEAGQQ